MAIVRWYSQPQYSPLRRQLESMYETNNRTDSVQTTETSSHWQPAAAWQETEENYVLSIQLPGLTAENVEVEATRNTISIRGEYSRSNQDKIVYSEFNYGRFNRSFKLSLPIENEQIQAKFNNGILILTLPKLESAINRVVKVDLTQNSNREAATA